MTSRCPHCSTQYLLPPARLGARGARVHCPACAGEFIVRPDGAVEVTAPMEPIGANAMPVSAGQAMRPQVPVGTGGTVADEVDAAPVAVLAEAEGSDELPSARRLARDVLGQLAVRCGEPLFEAAAARRLFARFGPDVCEAFERYLASGGQDPAAFLQELHRRFGVDLRGVAETR